MAGCLAQQWSCHLGRLHPPPKWGDSSLSCSVSDFIFFLACILESNNYSSTWASAPCIAHLAGTQGPWLWPGLPLTTADIWGVNRWWKDISQFSLLALMINFIRIPCFNVEYSWERVHIQNHYTWTIPFYFKMVLKHLFKMTNSVIFMLNEMEAGVLGIENQHVLQHCPNKMLSWNWEHLLSYSQFKSRQFKNTSTKFSFKTYLNSWWRKIYRERLRDTKQLVWEHTHQTGGSHHRVLANKLFLKKNVR